jgi:parallel beta-helix repeat protein
MTADVMSRLMHMEIPKVRYAIMLLATIMGSTLAFLPMPALATPPVFAAPACGDIITVSTTLTADVGPCSGLPSFAGLEIAGNNIVLNCAGHTISGPGGGGLTVGIILDGLVGVTIKNCNITGFRIGLICGCSNSILKGNTIDDNQFGGFGFAVSSDSNVIEGNTANNNGNYGFLVVAASNDNVFRGNTANGNSYGFRVSFPIDLPDSSSNNIFQGNTANSNSVLGYFDLTTGSGTGGTANFYQGDGCANNIVGGASPTGLCMPQP